MPVQRPTIAGLRTIVDRHGLGLDDEDLASFRDLMMGVLPPYGEVERLPQQTLPVRYPRESGWRADEADNPLNTWYWRCAITGAEDGTLAGKRIAIKDNVAVAGVPIMNGCSVLEGYIPEVDETVVTRIHEAGGEIAGKAACEDLCFSGGSHVPNRPDPQPLEPRAVRRRLVGRQHGARRQRPCRPRHRRRPERVRADPLLLVRDRGPQVHPRPRPLHGRVPVRADPRGPPGRSAGPWARSRPSSRRSRAPRASTRGSRPTSSPRPTPVGWPRPRRPPRRHRGRRVRLARAVRTDVDDTVREVAQRFEQAGASGKEVAVPMHRAGIHVWNAIAVEGATAPMIKGNGLGTNYEGFYTTSLLDASRAAARLAATTCPRPSSSCCSSASTCTSATTAQLRQGAERRARSPCRLRRGARGRRRAVHAHPADEGHAIPDPAGPRAEWIARALEMLPNSAPFDVTGHPAITVPCGMASGLPVGMMLVGRCWDDATVLQAVQSSSRPSAASRRCWAGRQADRRRPSGTPKTRQEGGW